MDRLSRHGTHLMSLASLGQAAVLVLLLMHLLELSKLARDDALGNQELVLLCLVRTAAWLLQAWMLSRLRLIGRLLGDGNRITRQMANAWRQLALAIVWAGLATSLTPGLALVRGTAVLETSLDWTGLFFILVAWLSADAVARIIQDASELKAENEAFI